MRSARPPQAGTSALEPILDSITPDALPRVRMSSHDDAETDKALKFRPEVKREDVHSTVALAANYLRDLGIQTDDHVMLALTALFGETHAEVPTAADTSIILSAESLQRALLTIQSGKPQSIGMGLPMLDTVPGTLHAIGSELGYTLPCCGKSCEGGNDE